MRQTRMYVDLKEFNENIRKIKEYVGDKTLLPVIKANGYGTYVNKDLDTLNQFDIVGVAIVDEAIEIRKLGYKKDIFVLNQPFADEIEDIHRYDISVGISEITFIKKVIEGNTKIKVHLEIETGMNRTGIKEQDLKKIIDLVKESPNFKVEGVYTHFSSADFDDEYTKKQIEIFKRAVPIVLSEFKNIKYIHSSASNGLLNYNDGVSNTVRPGIIMYGYEPYDNGLEKIKTKPICKLVSRISYLKELDAGESIGYSRKFITKEKMKIATIAIGYADGIRRNLTNKGFVVIRNEKVPIVGGVCMDSFMVDVTSIKDVSVGDEVYIWDNDKLTVEEVAKLSDTINYEVICDISNRVPRIFQR